MKLQLITFSLLLILFICQSTAERINQNVALNEIIVLGGYGDLSLKKIYPALFSLWKYELLEENTKIVGFGRREMKLEAFRELAGKYVSDEDEGLIEVFMSKIVYFAGDVDRDGSYRDLDVFLSGFESPGQVVNRLFYLALPPNLFAVSSGLIKDHVRSASGWNKLIIEKPFGRDLTTFNELAESMESIWPEKDTFRIDHYLGKEMVINILDFRLANPDWDTVWNKENIEEVQIRFKENFGTYGRGGYFDSYGIIRDVIQNHLCQVFSLVAMELPTTSTPESVRDQKVEVLKKVLPIQFEDLSLGQYVANGDQLGYSDDETVPKGSNTETWAKLKLFIDNERWNGVPFVISSGKALDESIVDVQIKFKQSNEFLASENKDNTLTFRIQPNPIISGFNPEKTISVFNQNSDFDSEKIPLAYARLLYASIQGDAKLFVRVDELEASWTIFTPILHKIESGTKETLISYPYGSPDTFFTTPN